MYKRKLKKGESQKSTDTEREDVLTNSIAERITEELNCETVFTIPILGGIPVNESVVVTWIIMAVLTILSVILVRKSQSGETR